MKITPVTVGILAALVGGGVYLFSRSAGASGPGNFYVIDSKLAAAVPGAQVQAGAAAVAVIADEAHAPAAMAAARKEAEEHPEVLFLFATKETVIALAAEMGYDVEPSLGEGWGGVAAARGGAVTFERTLSAEGDTAAIVEDTMHAALDTLGGGLEASAGSELGDAGALLMLAGEVA